MSTSPMRNTPQEVAGRRTGSPHTSMFVRMLIRAAVLRRGRAVAALFAMVVGAAVVTANRQPFDLTFQERTIHLIPAGVLQTGAGEDSRIYVDQSEFQNWTGVAPTTIEIAVNGSTAEIENGIARLAQALPSSDVRP